MGMLLAAITYVFRFQWVELYTTDSEVIQLAAILLVYAALYQTQDALQSVGAGILRGMGKTSYTMFVTFICYWGIGLGEGYLLAFTDWITSPMGVQGFWLGIVLGLSLAAILLMLRVWQQSQLSLIQWEQKK